MPAPTAPELTSAITEPARFAGLKLEPGLVDLVLRDIAAEPGALPLLSHALRATWERRDGRTVETYEVEAGHVEAGDAAGLVGPVVHVARVAGCRADVGHAWTAAVGAGQVDRVVHEGVELQRGADLQPRMQHLVVQQTRRCTRHRRPFRRREVQRSSRLRARPTPWRAPRG